MQVVDLTQPICAAQPGQSPLVINVNIKQRVEYTVGGPMSGNDKVVNYVLFQALPVDLQEKIKSAVQTLMSGM